MSEPALLETFEIEGDSAPTHSIIWMHGLGASNRDFESIVPELNIATLRYVFPAAPVRRVTINGGMAMPAWYDILSLQDPPLREKEEDVRQAYQDIERLVEREHARGIPYERILIAGFSQGAAMALLFGTRFGHSLGGVICLSGYLILPDTFEEERTPQNNETEILFCHGSMDGVVPLALGRHACAVMKRSGYPVRFIEYPMAHSLCLEEVADLRAFLTARIAAT